MPYLSHIFFMFVPKYGSWQSLLGNTEQKHCKGSFSNNFFVCLPIEFESWWPLMYADLLSVDHIRAAAILNKHGQKWVRMNSNAKTYNMSKYFVKGFDDVTCLFMFKWYSWNDGKHLRAVCRPPEAEKPHQTLKHLLLFVVKMGQIPFDACFRAQRDIQWIKHIRPELTNTSSHEIIHHSNCQNAIPTKNMPICVIFVYFLPKEPLTKKMISIRWAFFSWLNWFKPWRRNPVFSTRVVSCVSIAVSVCVSMAGPDLSLARLHAGVRGSAQLQPTSPWDQFQTAELLNISPKFKFSLTLGRVSKTVKEVQTKALNRIFSGHSI